MTGKRSYFMLGILGLLVCAGCTLLTSESESVPLTDAEKKLLECSTQEYWNRVSPPEVPRAFDVHRDGCPVCGERIKKHGMYSWILDPKKPFKVQCPECKTIFPDNDFEAYLKSGMKDKSLLTGKYVDDGRGWRPAPGQHKYWFVAYYNHWINYQDKEQVDKTDAKRLARAYRRTGNPEFARRTLAWLDHLADYYPDYDYSKQSRYAEEVLPTYSGRFVNLIWESLLETQNADAYLWTRDFLEKEDAELSRVTGKTSAQIKHNIEERLFRTVVNDVVNRTGKVSGNYGMPQRALLKAAKVLNEPKHAKWVAEFRADGMPLEYAFYNNAFSDGGLLEAPGYNVDWLDTFIEMFQILKELGIDEFAKHKVLHHIFTCGSKLMVCGKFLVPASGDSGCMSNVDNYTGYFNTVQIYYELFPSPYSARMLSYWEKSMDKDLREKILSEADMDFGYESNLLASYGFGTLQNGNRKAPTAVVLAFPNYENHRHHDLLNLDFFAEDVNLIPDFGYPDSCSSDDPTRMGIYLNTFAHNTVVVDCKRQNLRAGMLRRYDSGSFAQYVSADARAYSYAPLYRRSDLVIDAAPGKTIVFDVFDVEGGSQHDWFMHSAGETAFTSVPFTAQEGGTLAGKDVPYGTFYDAPDYQKMLEGDGAKDFNCYMGSGFQYLTNVCSTAEVPGLSITLPADKSAKVTPLPGAALKMHLLDDQGTVYLSQGKPPLTQENPQKHVKFVSRRRIGTVPLSSCFRTVLENTSDARGKYDIVSAVSIPAGEGVSATKVSLKNGTVLYMFIAEEQADFTCDGYRFQGRAGALKIAGKAMETYVNGAGKITQGNRILVQSEPDLEAAIVKVNLGEESIELDCPVPQSYTGHVFQANGCSYQVDKIEGRKVFLRDQSMIRGRSRFMKHSSPDQKSGEPVPRPSMLKRDLTLYRGAADQATFAGRVTLLKGYDVVADTELALNEDYWFSECGPGDKVVFQSSKRSKVFGK